VRQIICALIAAAFAAGAAQAQPDVPWRHTPGIAVVGAVADARQPLVDEAVAFWNQTLTDIGSGFRLGTVIRVARPVPEEALRLLSRAILEERRGRAIPHELRDPPGDLTIFLASSAFVSFTVAFDADGKRVVGIRNGGAPPMSLPNVARNVIAHELGHAVGLRHNSDPTLLMCGRPAACRPEDFRSDQPRMFALSDDEKDQLLAMYPAAWQPQLR